MAAGAAPEVPVLAYLAIGLLALLSWIVLRGLTSAYRATFGWFLERLAEILPAKHWYFPVDLRGSVRGIDNAMLHTLSFAAAKSEHAAGYFFHGAAVIQEWGWRELRHLAHESEQTFTWLSRIHVPKLVKYAIPLVALTALVVRIVRAEIKRAIPQTAKVAHAAAHAATVPFTTHVVIPHLGELQWIHRHWKAIAAAAAAPAVGLGAAVLPNVHIFPRLRALERWEGYTRKRLRRLEALLGVTAFAGLMAKVLGLPNWRCLTRGNVGRTARALCGLPAHFLNDLLGLLVDFFVIADICEVVGLLSDAFALIEPELLGFVGVAGSALCHGDYAPPPLFAAPPIDSPPLQAGAPAFEV